MHRKRKIVVNLALIAAALLTLLFLSGVHLTADNAVRAAERGMHYGPSQTVYTLDSQGGRYYLGRYGRYCSVIQAERRYGLFWKGNGVSVLEREEDKPVQWTYYGRRRAADERMRTTYYGVRADSRTAEIRFRFHGGRTVTITEFHDDLFLWQEEGDPQTVEEVEGFDREGNQLFRLDSFGNGIL